MNLTHVMIILRKELKDIFRDRKTFLVSIILPMLMMPIIMLFSMLGAKEMTDVKPEKTPIIVINEGKNKSLLELLIKSDFNIITDKNPEQLLQDGKVKAIIIIPSNFETKINNEKKAQLTIKMNESDPKSGTTVSIIKSILDQYTKQIIKARLLSKNINPDILDPINIDTVNVAPPQKTAGSFLSLLIPMFLVMWIATGGINAAVDLTAGEKERGTLEPLLSTTCSRSSIITAKYLAVAIMSIIGGLSTLLGLIASFLAIPHIIDTGNGQGIFDGYKLSIEVSILMIISILLTAIIFSAIEVALGAYARSFKEGQTYLSPLSFVVLIPAFLTMYKMPNEIPFSYYIIPIMNSIAIFKEFILNEVNILHLFAFIGSSLVYVVIAINFSTKVFQNEKVLFRH
ncbi:ABC transporter permease [Caldicellulosiruptoraceae bacterium PP1]